MAARRCIEFAQISGVIKQRRACVPSCDASSARLLLVAASTDEVRRTSAAAISSAVLCGPFAVSSCQHAQ